MRLAWRLLISQHGYSWGSELVRFTKRVNGANAMAWVLIGTGVVLWLAAAFFLSTGKAFANLKTYERRQHPRQYWAVVVGAALLAAVLTMVGIIALRKSNSHRHIRSAAKLTRGSSWERGGNMRRKKSTQ